MDNHGACEVIARRPYRRRLPGDGRPGGWPGGLRGRSLGRPAVRQCGSLFEFAGAWAGRRSGSADPYLNFRVMKTEISGSLQAGAPGPPAGGCRPVVRGRRPARLPSGSPGPQAGSAAGWSSEIAGRLGCRDWPARQGFVVIVFVFFWYCSASMASRLFTLLVSFFLYDCLSLCVLYCFLCFFLSSLFMLSLSCFFSLLSVVVFNNSSTYLSTYIYK